jgi:UDPglucose--hexose-1-phosphate uridylyltransferase
MSELRKDPIVDRWVIIADGTGRTPIIPKEEGFSSAGILCPFCPGNEHLCPPEILSNRPSDSQPNDSRWRLRVVPNRSPILVVEEDLKRMGEGLYDKISGIGANEVIIETPRHDIRQSQMESGELENIFWAYRDRVLDLKRDTRMRYVLLYKNYGQMAGATLDHQYSILMGLPIVPRGVLEEVEGAKKHFDYKERCVYCDIIRQEIQQEIRVISETKDFLAIEPFAPRVPFETWILPKRHTPRYENIEPREIREIALIFKEVVLRLDEALNNPAYNYVIHTTPFNIASEQYYHWHMEILPRLTFITGFEWGSDVYINSTSPEDAASFLKEIIV